MDCIPGRYNDVEKNTDCIDCEIGKASIKIGRKVQCTDCVSGRYQSDAGTTACLNCIPGKFQRDTGKISCINCEVNYYTDTVKQNICKSCEVGTYALNTGSASCSDCGAGTFGVGCKMCPIGWARAASGGKFFYTLIYFHSSYLLGNY